MITRACSVHCRWLPQIRWTAAACLMLALCQTVTAEGPAIRLELPQQHFLKGDEFILDAVVTSPAAGWEARLAVLLQADGQYWFWPSWREAPAADSRPFIFPAGQTSVRIIEPFPWPDIPGAGEAVFYAALLDNGLTQLQCPPARVSWSYGDQLGGLTITREAYWKTGPAGAGQWLLPSGRLITPYGLPPSGHHIAVDSLPLAMVLHSEQELLIASASGPGAQSLTVIDLSTGETVQRHQEQQVFKGLTVSPDGATLYAAGGGSDQIAVFDIDNRRLTNRRSWPVTGFPGAMDISPDGKVLYIACEFEGQLKTWDTETGAQLGAAAAGGNPSAVLRHPSRPELYVCSQRDNYVAVFDVSDPSRPQRTSEIATGKNPEALALAQDRAALYVANADDDSVSVIDVNENAVVSTIDLRTSAGAAFGTGPNALAFSPDGSRLFIAQAHANAVDIIGLPAGTLIGAIPTGWFPTALAIAPSGQQLAVANAKGTGSGPSGATSTLVNRGTLSVFTIPDDRELPALTAQVQQNNALPGKLFDLDPEKFANPVPRDRGDPTPIKHVVFIVRENKTYDALLGDWPNGDGDPGHCLYCGEETRNLRAMVNQFASGDNYYSNAEVSLQGHYLLTAGIVNTWLEKHWPVDWPLPIEIDTFLNPVCWPKSKFIFQTALQMGISFRVYGEEIGLAEDGLIFDERYVHWGPMDPPVFWLFSRDVDKLAERIAEMESGLFPSLIFMLFPNDHHFGCTFPFQTPVSMVADNDLATGLFLDWLSHSVYWPETVVFLTEDDPQQGTDHVDAHRTLLMVASPYAKRGYVSPVHYSEANLLATIEHILGMPPLTVYDATAQPMWDLFTNEPDFTPFTSLPRTVPEEVSLPGTNCAMASAGKNFLDPDEAEGLQEITWEYEQALKQTARERDALERISRRYPWGWQEIWEAMFRSEANE